MPELRSETMTVNMGPQHPSTHGVLRLVLELDGENIVSIDPTIGFLHTGIEKTAEQKKWQQIIPLVERMDYLGAAVEQPRVLPVGRAADRPRSAMPDRVIWIRVLIAELQRLSSHLVWLGTHGMEIGAISVMMYCFREREQLLNLNEMLAGLPDVPELHPHRRPARGSAARVPRGRQGVPRQVSRQARRVREAADQEPGLDQADEGRRQALARRHDGDGRSSGRSRAPSASRTTCARRSRT